MRFRNAGKVDPPLRGLKSNACILPKLIDVKKGSLYIILLNDSKGADIVPLDVNNSLYEINPILEAFNEPAYVIFVFGTAFALIGSV